MAIDRIAMRVAAGVRRIKRNPWRMSESVDTSAHTNGNPAPPIPDATDPHATVDVSSGRPRSAFGEYREA